MVFIDLSHPLGPGQASFPNDPKTAIMARGTVATHQYNISHVLMSTHQGTHLDAMFHFFNDGRPLDQMPLSWFHGPASVLRMPMEPSGEESASDLPPHERRLLSGARIMMNTGWYRHFGATKFFAEFPSFSLDAACYLAARKIRLLGMDMPKPGNQWLELHHVLRARDSEIVVLESPANLGALPDEFVFAGFPLKFQGRGGSPIRDVAICE